MRKLGIHIPDATIEELKGGIGGAEITCRFLDSLVRDHGVTPDGIHIMALGDIEATNFIISKFKKDHLK
jgi:hypothetical protein